MNAWYLLDSNPLHISHVNAYILHFIFQSPLIDSADAGGCGLPAQNLQFVQYIIHTDQQVQICEWDIQYYIILVQYTFI